MFFCCTKKEEKKDTIHHLPIINWNMAMEQCGNDEKFLLELLNETSNDIHESLPKITIDNDPTELKDIAHMIKGVCQNLMCEDLSKSFSDLEQNIMDGKKYSEEIKNVIESIKKFDEFMEERNVIE